MFLKFQVKIAIAKLITLNNLHSDTLELLESVIDDYIQEIQDCGYDADQGAVMVITSAITHAASKGVLPRIKLHMPIVYKDLVCLWRFCGLLYAEDEARWGSVVIVGSIGGNPFEYAERHF